MKKPAIGFIDILRSSTASRIKLIKLFDLLAGSVIAFILPAKKGFADPDFEIKRFLIIRPGGLGDAIFLLPLLWLLKGKTKIQADILCEKRNAQIFLSQGKMCHQVYCYDQLSSFLKVFGNTYDVVVDTEQWHYLSAIVARLIPSKKTVGFSTRPLRAKLFSEPVKYLDDAYELVNFQNILETAVKKNLAISNIDSCFSLKNNLLSWVSQEIPTNTISLFLGASIPERRLSEKQARKIIAFALKEGLNVALLGGRDALETGKLVEQKVKSPNLLNFIGKTTLEQSAALIKRSKLFIGTDSGLMHLACAVGTPVVAIFSSGNESKWGPRGNGHTVFSTHEKCAPCTRYSYTIPTCKGKYPCMKNIHLEGIFEAIGDKS